MAETARKNFCKRRFLIVEEDFYHRWYLRRILEPYTNCDVAVRGEEAVDVFKLSMESGTPYALVLLDVRLPEMSGDMVLQEIRKIEQNKYLDKNTRTKVLLISSEEERTKISDKTRNDCEGMIAKPIIDTEFFNALRSIGAISI